MRQVRLAAAALVATLGVSAFVLTTLASPAYATGIGERRVVVLSDGSRIELNTNSKVVVRYRDGLREVELIRGEAVFDVAREARPFVVMAKAARLEAQRGEIVVRLRGDEAQVNVRQGLVSVATPGSAPSTLAPGLEADLGPDGARVGAIGPAKVERTLAWRQGAISLDGQSLAEAAEEFNRYNTEKIVADSSIANLRVGGYFQTSDVSGRRPHIPRARRARGRGQDRAPPCWLRLAGVFFLLG
jgi:transmembrane sensor